MTDRKLCTYVCYFISFVVLTVVLLHSAQYFKSSLYYWCKT